MTLPADTEGSLRVEELADRVGVTVDTVRYYQAKGLLHPPRRQGRLAWYDTGHVARLERIRSLQAKGFTLATIHRVLNGELDAADEALVGAMAGEVLHADDHLLTLDELASRTGIPAPLLLAVRHEGLLVPSRVGDAEGYTADDVDVARAGLTILEHGIPLPELLDLARVHHQAMEDVARRAVALFDAYVRQPARHDRTDRGVADGGDAGNAADTGDAGNAADTGDAGDGAERLVEAFLALLPATTTVVAHHFTRVLLHVALQHIERVGSDEELHAVDVARARPGPAVQATPPPPPAAGHKRRAEPDTTSPLEATR